jgi:hypothetical protein
MDGKWMNTERNANGRFAAGRRGGPGRPRREVEAQYLVAFREAVPLETWGAIVTKAVDQALEGDARARDWISSYVVGRPYQAVEVDVPSGPKLSLGMLLMAIRQAIPDGDAQARIADALLRLAREATGDDSYGDQPVAEDHASVHRGPLRYPLSLVPPRS